MDRRGTALLTTVTCAGLLLSGAAFAGEKGSIRALGWLAAEGQFEALSSEPITRLDTDDISRENIRNIAVGQVLFNTPSILGGQAARAGITCASCHSNGRLNSHFQFPGVSGEPGTADVTHSFFSSKRGDGIFNPVPIPDLTKPGNISHDPETKELERFVRNLIVEEFDGVEPSGAVLKALSTYVRSITHAPDEGMHLHRGQVTIETHLDRAEEAFEQAVSALQDGDSNLANLLFSGARHQCRLIHERFLHASLDKEARIIEKLARELGDVQVALMEDQTKIYEMAENWEHGFSRARDVLGEASHRSLYNPIRLRKFLSSSSN